MSQDFYDKQEPRVEFERKVITEGKGSKAVNLPTEICDALGIKEGDTLVGVLIRHPLKSGLIGVAYAVSKKEKKE